VDCSTRNANGEWDWWHIDAGDDDRFVVKPQYDGDPRLIHQPTYPSGGPRDRWPLRCDGGPRGLLDFDAARNTAVARAQAQLHAEQKDYARLVADHPPAEPLTVFLERHRANPDGYPREQAVADHHAQPLVRALNRTSAWDRYPNLGLWVLGPDSDPVSRFTRDSQPDLDRAAAWAITASALLTLDGEWVDTNALGSFTHVLPGEDRDTTYARQSTAYLDELDEDCVVVGLLCHC
jgi:hypothetical protein